VKLLLAALALAAACPAAASADSIVYAKQGNLFLTTADGTRSYQLTSDGGYSSPSQADDGTIGAVRYKQLVRLDRSGRALNAPIDAMGSAPGPIGGPYEARISPDGSRFAYYFYVQTSWDDPQHNIRWIDTGSYGTWTYADHFTSPASESEYEKSFTQPEWVANDRVLGTMGMYLNMWTWELGTGHGYTWPAAQWWFGLRDPVDQWGVSAYHWYDDPALSRDGTQLAMTDSGQQLVLARTHGPAWSGEPPYESPDYVDPESGLAAPTIECRGPVVKTDNPTWSSDGTHVAYGAPDGVHVINADCSGDRLIAPGGSEPAFGPADVVVPAAAITPAAPPAPAVAKAAAPRLSRVSLHPKAFRAARGTTVRFTLGAPARVVLKVAGTKASLAVDAKAGANTVRFRRRGLSRGSHRLIIGVKGGPTASLSFRILR
jgi:hypothetical protein